MNKIIKILKVFLFFVFLISPIFSQVNGQWLKPWSWYNKIVVSTGTTYNARATLFFTRVTADGITLTTTQKTFYNNLFQNLIDSALIHATDPAGDSLEVFYWFAVSDTAVVVDSNLVNLNLLQDNYNAIHYGTVTYTDSGVVGNGSTGYLNTGFNPVSDSSIFKKNSASYGVYSKTNSLSGQTCDMGGTDGTNRNQLLIYYAGSQNLFAVNSNFNCSCVNLFYVDYPEPYDVNVRVEYKESSCLSCTCYHYVIVSVV